MMNYSNSPAKEGYGKSTSCNYYHFAKLSLPQQGKLAPVRSGVGISQVMTPD